jgi:hypothetical protein
VLVARVCYLGFVSAKGCLKRINPKDIANAEYIVVIIQVTFSKLGLDNSPLIKASPAIVK